MTNLGQIGTHTIGEYVGRVFVKNEETGKTYLDWTNLEDITEGSEKQISWAESLRHKLLDQVATELNSNIAKYPADKQQMLIDISNKVLDDIKSQTSAKWFIDNKDTMPETIIKATMQKVM